MLLIIITALLPVLILGWWIYKKDSAHPEPLKQLLLAFFFGVGSAFVSMLISAPLMLLFGISPDIENVTSLSGALSIALFAAAIPEECAKLLMLWLFLRHNKHYDQYIDGIVYAACVGLGFAGAENILYLLGNEEWLMVGIVRGLTAVPAHFAIACAMGYYYSKRHYGDRSGLTRVCILAVPIVIHWIYDALAFSEAVYPALSVVINVLFVLVIVYMYKSTMRRIAEMLKRDQALMTPPPIPPR